MSQHPPSVLVVEDDDNIRELLSTLLESEDVEIVTAADGQIARELIDTLDPPPAAVLLDILLPFQDGFQLLAHIEGRHAWADVPVLILSSRSKDREIADALESRATSYMAKPFQPLELLSWVKNHLQQ